jgi:hypothetical protein
MPEGQLEKTPGDLLATVRFAYTRGFPGELFLGDALLIFERCLVFSGGRSREVFRRSFTLGLNPLNIKTLMCGPWQWYDERLAADANRGLSELVAAHPRNWIVWSTDVVKWDLRAGIGTSRLRLELINGTRRKVLWHRRMVLWGYNTNSLPPIRAALHRALAGSTRP